MNGKTVGFLLVLLLHTASIGAFKPGKALGQELAEASGRDASGVGADALERDAHSVHSLGIRTLPAGAKYRTGAIGTFVLGEQYRSVWAMAVDMPVLDLAHTAGGLTVTGAAGGAQTSLLFLEGADGRHFILRTIDKDAGDALPEGVRRTIVEDIAQDQVSALNPYAALVIADLADAAGILHTAPSLVVVPDDARLGEHREAFAGKPALLERKVDEDVSDLERFGNAEEVIDFEELVRRLDASPKVRVDQRAFVRTRLFDMWIGDRDRHDGQYFWAASENGMRYVPLPIDRDFAFARFDGVLNRIGRFSGKIDFRKQTYFADDIDNLLGLNYQGAKLDYRFSSELTRDDWIGIARDLQAALTDPVIEEAIAAWPAPVFEAIGRETIETLKSRRDHLGVVAVEYYKTMVQKVDVVGTSAPDRFRIDRSEKDYVVVSIESPGEGRWYRRRFSTADTDEIRMFGLGGNDAFVVSGADGNGILVFAIGGTGEDAVRMESDRMRTDPDRRLGMFTFIDTELPTGSRSGVDFEAVDDSSDLSYTFHRYELDRVGPLVTFDYDSDEGVYLGGGIKLTRFGFRREPYAAKHRLRANYAPTSRAYNVHYRGDMHEVVGEWDARWEADVLDEERFDDFYGFGNETQGSDATREQFLARFRWVRVFPAFYRDLSPLVSVGMGPYVEYADIEAPSGFTEEKPPAGLVPEQLIDKYFAGLRTRLEVDARDTTVLPESGFRWLAEAGFHAGIRHTDIRFTRLASEISFFYTPPLPGRMTVALRAGGATNIGDFTFYQANALGGRENLRGFRKTRFSGRSSAFGNAELRVKLTDFNVYLTRGELGVLGFYDIGRVWADDETSRLWHQGYGAGVWATPFYRIIVHGRMGFSDEGSATRISLGMFF